MKIIFVFILTSIIGFSSLYAQEINLKKQALNEFKNEHYDKSIELLEKALEQSPNDAEIYYYLGFFNHYRAYDSRPLEGYDFDYTEKIFEYLEKAIELNPNYGDAKYFYGAECSGNAFLAMQNYNLDKLKYFYKKAYDKGAYPNWLLEFGENILNSCDKDAILFVGGNADFDVCTYLQLHKNFRNDVTVIPIGNIDRPWYVKFLKDGLKNGVTPLKINLTNNQIYDIHPFKWDTTTVSIPISKSNIKKYNTENSFKWTIIPDLKSERKHSKIKGEKVKYRTYLSPQRAILLQIVQNNFNERPIFFSNLANPIFFGGLNENFSNYGLVSKLTPIKTENTEFKIDYSKIESLLQKEKLQNFPTIKENDIPRISGITFMYHNSLMKLSEHYRTEGKEKELKNLTKFYSKYLAIEFKPDSEKKYLDDLKSDKK